MKETKSSIETPTLSNSVIRKDQILSRPVYVNKTAAAEMFGVSKSTIYNWCQEAEESKEWSSLSVRPSSTVTLIHVETMEEFLKSKNKSFL